MQTKDTARSAGLQVRAANRNPRGRPAFAESQRTAILRLLRGAGVVGVDRDFVQLQQSLSSADRNLMLRATLGLFLRRLNHNLPVFRDDLLRLAYYAEDAPERLG